MTNNLIKYKRIIWALSIAVVILILSNYSALRKLDLIIRAPLDKIEEIASAYTPVPGGVGPMTINTLILNTLKSAQKSLEKNN